MRCLDEDLRILAGAGSGKTTVLVRRFLHAVTEKKVSPENILAITFTDKAAHEMKKRLVLEFEALGLESARRKLENAAIGTIHSFCARLLKENPIESGVDPAFQILSEGESDILISKIIDRLLEEETEKEGWQKLLSDIGEDSARRCLKDLYDKSQALGGEEILLRSADFKADKIEAKARMMKCAQGIPEANGVKLKTALTSPAQGWDLVNAVHEAAAGLEKKGPQKEAAKEVLALCQRWTAAMIQELAVPAKVELVRVFSRFKDAYDREKRQRASYDFEDLLFLAHKLLSSERPEQSRIRRRYQKKFTYIFVDEYQDTSPLQAKIIELLKCPGNLFVVGDVQQSIYGFRYADPEVFASLGPKSDARSIVLADNFRSRPEVLDFVNAFFDSVFPKAHFYPLKAMRVFTSKKDGPAIEFLCVPRTKEEAENLDASRVVEARSLAARIRGMVDSQFLIEPEKGRVRPIEYRDIAILLRTTSSLQLYEKELSDFSIPCFTVRGKGFYAKTEVKDLLNFLRILGNPNEDIALAGVLRSPLVGVSDDALFFLARAAKAREESRPLVLAFEDPVAIPGLLPEDLEKILCFKERLTRFTKNRDRLKVSELLHLVLTETDYEAKLLTLPEGRQKAANALKFVDLAASVEKQNSLGLEDFVHYVEKLSEREGTEAEARVEVEATDTVTLTTIHTAKGLEFPCVIVANLGSQESRWRGAFCLASLEEGLGVCLKNPKTRQWHEDAAYRDIKEKLIARQKAEEERLLYVAMTRAKEHLILSGSLALDTKTGLYKKDSSWSNRLAEFLGFLSPKDLKDHTIARGLRVLVTKIEKESRRTGKQRLLVEELETQEAQDSALVANLKKRLEPVRKDYEWAEDLSVTELLLASQKDAPFKEEISEDEAALSLDLEEGTPRNEFGTIFHRVMELTLLARKRKQRPPDLASILSPLTETEKKEIQESVAAFWKSSWGHAVASARRLYMELPFIYKTRRGLLKGQMDLVFQMANGEWVILDYKTNRLKSAQKEALAADYALQLALYALVFKKLYGEVPQKGVLYFSAIHEAHETRYRGQDFEDFEKELDLCFQKAVL